MPSLVGSEMCIRDSGKPDASDAGIKKDRRLAQFAQSQTRRGAQKPGPLPYPNPVVLRRDGTGGQPLARDPLFPSWLRGLGSSVVSALGIAPAGLGFAAWLARYRRP